ncbi:MAG: transcription antitermination factor NusB [Gammaproteobacteria bacterium]|nr:transcription antitermination factor NusB [Gammaproteobacteria bacterium]
MSSTTNRARMRARRCAVQALYQWQLADQEPADIRREFLSDREMQGVDPAYFERLVVDIPRYADALVGRLGAVVDRPWRQIDPVERAVLLVGAYELAHCPEIPWRVVLNEGVELAKMFGAEQGHRFVNAALDRLAHELREAEVAAAR